jgi:hypothetical protein
MVDEVTQTRRFTRQCTRATKEAFFPLYRHYSPHLEMNREELDLH